VYASPYINPDYVLSKLHSVWPCCHMPLACALRPACMACTGHEPSCAPNSGA
jgi:hypothetical protein